MATRDSDTWVPGDPIGYITQEVPEFETHPYEGKRSIDGLASPIPSIVADMIE